MTEEIKIEEVEEKVKTEEPIDLIQTNGQIHSRPYIYKVKQNNDWKHIVVIAPNSTTARQGIAQQFNGCTISFIGVGDGIIQVQ